MHSYARQLKALFGVHADPKQAGPMKRYMRDQFEYLGLKVWQMSALLKRHIEAHGLPALADLDEILRDLWGLPQREFEYAANGLLARFEDRLPAGFIRTLEYLLVTRSWWDTVDTIAIGTVGLHFQRYPKVKARYLAKWRRSNNFWLRRTCILFQLNYKKETDFPLMRAIIRENLGSKEFFINKAIGWALRQYTRVDPQGVRQFVAEIRCSLSAPARPSSGWRRGRPRAGAASPCDISRWEGDRPLIMQGALALKYNWASTFHEEPIDGRDVSGVLLGLPARTRKNTNGGTPSDRRSLRWQRSGSLGSGCRPSIRPPISAVLRWATIPMTTTTSVSSTRRAASPRGSVPAASCWP